MRLSLCLAVFNEEKNIHYPLDSAYDLADEVIIVDGGSADKTVEIAKSYGAKVKVFVEDNPAMFHINKQKAIEHAIGEWILQLDADESLSSELKREISSIVNSRRGQYRQYVKRQMSSDAGFETDRRPVAFWLPRKNFFLTRFLMKGGQYPDYTIRLYRNGCAKFPCRDVHENVEIIDKSKGKRQKAKASFDKLKIPKIPSEVEGQGENKKFEDALEIGFLRNPILHYADPDFSRYLMRWDRYTTLEVQSKKENSSLMFVEYFFWKPLTTFFAMYFRHLGFLDGFPGFVFSLFSSIRFWVIYIKYYRLRVSSDE